jgi:arylsulfatase
MKMNVLVFIVDSLRADHLSCYGYHRETTPNIDSFAENHTRYANAFTPATWTRSVAASLLTGAYPSVHKVQMIDDQFGADLPRWPELFAENGYYTAMVSAIGNVSSGLGFSRGFREFIDLYKDETLDSHRTDSTADQEMLAHESDRVIFPLAEQVIERFEQTVLQRDESEPFFAFLWTIDPHDPYQPPDGFDTFVDPDYKGPIDGRRESLRKASTEEDFQRLINLYDSEVSYTDYAFRQLLDLLEQYRVYDDTLVIFASDHGEAFDDHDGNVGHGHVPYKELIHVPVIIRYPHDGPYWNGEDELINLIDLMPTTLDYVGMEQKTSLPKEISGKSILNGGRTKVFSETNYSDVQNAFYSLRNSRWKYIKLEAPDGDFKSYLRMLTDIGFMKQFLSNPLYFIKRRFNETSEHLYDLQADSEETSNLIDEHEQSEKLRQELSEWRTQLERIAIDEEASEMEELDDKTEQQLRQMGYIE